MRTSFEKAFELIASNDKDLSEIINTTLEMAFTSSIIALLIGVLLGLLIASYDFPGKRIVVLFVRTLMGIPPVVVGVVCYMLFSATGPLGEYRLLYTVKGMIIAQIVLITPIVAGMTETAFSPIVGRMNPTLKGLNIGPAKKLSLSVIEGKYQFIALYLFAFARAISEVGAIQIVGGNIWHKTRTMTTAIALNYNTGDFSLAVAMGIILLMIALAVNLVAALIQFRTKPKYD